MAETDEQLVPVPIPALVAELVHFEKRKGSPLTQAEVLAARDKAVCIMMPVSQRDAMAASRGYPDLDLENVWEDWLRFKQSES